MPKSASHIDPSQTEMFRLLKIFGIASLSLVLILSFFNEYRANNSGEDPTFTIKDAGLLFFYNVRRIDYRTSRLAEAKLEIYTHKSFDNDSTLNTIILNIIVNKHNQTAFLFLKPQGNYINRKILLRNREGQKQDSLTISPNTSNRQTHLENVKTIGHWLEQESGNIEVLSSNKWTPIFERKKEKQAFLHSLNDFLKITGRH
ncbi:MAG: hypothetical protein GYB55_03245 [Cytophagales bacterium]|uniref:hypothetical protein n=1 Tax=Cyclobacterium marinum TaxID=104 RepID=UPI0030DC0A0C|nr:hypothetical protein [Cytophagales bacterium]|tara:strand:+ start:39357 stop:39962 length:606 start_codon:yes stop_codon:yes gene_type:complete